MWTVGKVIEHLENFNPDSVVIFQDRLGRETVEHEMIHKGILTLDVIIGVIE
jgi:hypothetical protein